MINITNEFQSIIDSGYPYKCIYNWNEVSFSINKPSNKNSNWCINSDKFYKIYDEYKIFIEIFEDFKNISLSLLEKYPKNIHIHELENEFKIEYFTPRKEKESKLSVISDVFTKHKTLDSLFDTYQEKDYLNQFVRNSRPR